MEVWGQGIYNKSIELTMCGSVVSSLGKAHHNGSIERES